ncbi:MAG: hypothetical protein ACQET6_08395 [Bacillota bacterium]|uniref:hypothetical protein n=1 Tax=Rossellomorea sp. FM04394 TaxID=3243076 RepID=UPI0035A5ECAB
MNEVKAYEFTYSKEEILEDVMNEYGKEVLYIAYSYVKGIRRVTPTHHHHH